MEDGLNFFLRNQNDDLKKKWKTTSKKINKRIEDDIKKKWKTTSKKIKNGRRPKKNQIEDNLNKNY